MKIKGGISHISQLGPKMEEHETIFGRLDPCVEFAAPGSAEAGFPFANRTITLTAYLVKGKSGAVDAQRYFFTDFNRHVLESLQETLKFNWSLLPTSASIEAPVNGSWFGAGALLLNGTADVSMDLSFLVPSRAQSFALLHPLFSDKVSVYFRQPPVSSVRDIYTQPFTTGVWLTLIGHLLFVWIAVMGLNYAQKRCRGKFPSLRSRSRPVTATAAFLCLITFVSMQGWYRRYQTFSLRIAFLVGSCAGLVLYISYAANLVSMLTVHVKPIQSLAQFMASGLPMYASDSSDTIRGIFNANLTTDLGSASGQAKSKPILYVSKSYSYTAVMNQSQNGQEELPSACMSLPYRFFSDTRLLNLTDSFYCSEVTEIEVMSTPFLAGWILSKKSLALRESFNVRIAALYTSGLLWRERRVYVDSFRPVCNRESTKEKKRVMLGLGLADTFTAFFVLLIGVGISIFAVAFERTVHENEMREMHSRT